MDCKIPIGMPHTSLIKSKKPTPGKDMTLNTALIFLKTPVVLSLLACSVVESFDKVLSIILLSLLAFGMNGMKAMTRKTLNNDPEAAKRAAVCSLEEKIDTFFYFIAHFSATLIAQWAKNNLKFEVM